MKRIILIFGIVCLSLSVSFGQNKTVNNTIRECPSFSMVDINNYNLSLETLKDKLIVINIIGYKNIQPQDMLKEFVAFSNDFNKDEAVFIAITGNVNDDIDNIKSFFNNSNYHLVVMNEEEYKKIVLLLNKFPATPLNFIIDDTGNIVYSKYSYFSSEELKEYKNLILSLTK